MTVPIDAAAGLIFLVSCAVGYAVYRHTRKVSTTVPQAGDLGTAFTAGSVTLVALAFLFGVTPGTGGQSNEAPPQSSSATSSPVPGQGPSTVTVPPSP